MHYQYGKNDLPNPQRPQKTSVLSKLAGRFKEKPATREEVGQLRLNTQREILKTQMQKAKSSRPSRFDGLGGGSSSGRTGHRRQSEPGLFGGGGGGDFLFGGGGQGPSLSFITGAEDRPKRRGSSQGSTFGSGLSDLF